MKLYLLETPGDYERFDVGVADELQLFTSRKMAEVACKDYNDYFRDEYPAWVSAVEVKGICAKRSKRRKK